MINVAITDASSAAPVPAHHERSWLPFAGAITMAVLVGGVLLGGYGIVVWRLQHSNAGREALAQMRGTPQLKELFGEPLKLHIEGGELAHEGQASFEMRVKGPKGAAMLELESRAENKAWAVVKGTIVRDGTETPLEPGPVPSPSPSPEAPANPTQHGPQP